MDAVPLAPRLRRLPVASVLGWDVRVAADLRARLLGLALLRNEEVGPGLLIPRCSSVHTFGMRFPLDLFFLDESGAPLAVRRRVLPRRLLCARNAASVLEMPAGAGESSGPAGA